MQKLTIEKFEKGEVDFDDVRHKDLREFCKEHRLEVKIPNSMDITEAVNAVIDAIESMPPENLAAPKVEQAKAEQKSSAPKTRPDGEVVKLSKSGKDHGSNCLNRMLG